MNSDKDKYVAEIEQTRKEIDRTLLTLEDKLAPRELWEQAIKWSGGLSINVGRVIKDNPIPAALLGISLIWLLVEGTKPQIDDVSERDRLNRRLHEIDPRLYI